MLSGPQVVWEQGIRAAGRQVHSALVTSNHSVPTLPLKLFYQSADIACVCLTRYTSLRFAPAILPVSCLRNPVSDIFDQHSYVWVKRSR